MKTSIKIVKVLFATLFLALTVCQVTGCTFDNPIAELVGLGTTGGLALASIVNPATITYNGDEVRDMQDAIMEAVYQNPELTSVHAIVTTAVNKKQIVFLGKLSKLTKKKTDCGGDPSANTIPLTEKFWNLQSVEFWLAQCATPLNESFWAWGLNKGIKRNDLTNTDFAEFLMERIDPALAEDTLRITWFNDTDAANVDDSPAGIITSGVDVSDYNMIDGLWKQIYTAVNANKTILVDITRNAGNSYTNQKFVAQDTTDKVVIGIFQSMIEGADTRLRAYRDKGLFFVATQSMCDQLRREYKSFNNIPDSFTMIIDGIKYLTYDGIPIIEMSFWDRTIMEDFDNGTTYYQPHRAVLTIKENIPVGFDAEEGIQNVENFYLPKEQTNNWRGEHMIDAKLLQEYLLVAAY